jgi:hypothetical protein
VLIYDKSLQIYGGFDNGFTTWAPSTYRTYIDGGTVDRGVYVLDDNGAAGPGFGNAALDLEGFTIRACKATGEAGQAGGDNVNAYGAGMWINTVARSTSTQGAFLLKNMVFRRDYAEGYRQSAPNTVIDGSASGAAVALRAVGQMTLDGVAFDTDGSSAGYSYGAQGGAVFLDCSTVTGNELTFYNCSATSASFESALGGGLAMFGSSASLQNVIALNNQIEGGGAAAGGCAYGGTFYAANSTLNLSNADIRGGIVKVTPPNLSPGLVLPDYYGPAGGGGIAALNSSVSLNQVQGHRQLREPRRLRRRRGVDLTDREFLKPLGPAALSDPDRSAQQHRAWQHAPPEWAAQRGRSRWSARTAVNWFCFIGSPPPPWPC